MTNPRKAPWVSSRGQAMNPTPPRLRSKFLWTVSPPVLRGVGRAFFSFRVDCETLPPPAPYVIAANHYSHFDPPVIACGLDRPVRFLALDNLFTESRLLDWLITGYGAIPTPRHRRPITAVRTALAALAAGEVVGVFPEATRVSHWGTLQPKRGAAWLAYRAGVPLLPVAVIGTGQAFGLENKVKRAPFRLVVGPALASEAGVTSLMTAWSAWMSETISRFPGTEVSGPPRSEWDGYQG